MWRRTRDYETCEMHALHEHPMPRPGKALATPKGGEQLWREAESFDLDAHTQHAAPRQAVVCPSPRRPSAPSPPRVHTPPQPHLAAQCSRIDRQHVAVGRLLAVEVQLQVLEHRMEELVWEPVHVLELAQVELLVAQLFGKKGAMVKEVKNWFGGSRD